MVDDQILNLNDTDDSTLALDDDVLPTDDGTDLDELGLGPDLAEDEPDIMNPADWN